MRNESEFVRHIPCPSCGSSDANAIYTDGHTFCHKCHTWLPGEGSPTHHPGKSGMRRSNFTVRGEPEPLRNRRLSRDTCQLYKIHVDGNQLRCHYINDKQDLVGAKIRTPDKQFSVEGGPLCLFGMNLFGKGKRIVITEGELDAASCYEAMPKWPMVSIPNGAGAAKKVIQKHLQYLQQFDEIVLLFDNDEEGIRAAKECAPVLPAGRVKIGSMGLYKDPSEALQARDPDAIRQAIWNATPYRPDGIVAANSGELFDLVMAPSPPCDHTYPWPGLQDMLHGIRYQELITITAGTGIGKSSFCRQLAVHLLEAGETVGYLALEESVRRTALGLMSISEGRPLHLEPEKDSEVMQEIWGRTMADWKLFLFDGFGSYEPDVIYNTIEWLAQGMECKVVFLDHLSILLSGLDGDERRMIDQTMTRLRSLVERTGITLFLVSHLRRSTGQGEKNHEEGARVTVGQLRGSASIAQLSDAVIGLERNQQDETDSGTTVRVLKNRYSGQTGIAGTLIYNPSTTRYDTDTFDPSKFNEDEDPEY